MRSIARRLLKGRQTTAKAGGRAHGFRSRRFALASDGEVGSLRNDAHSRVVKAEAGERTRHAGKLSTSLARSAAQLTHVGHRRSVRQDEFGVGNRSAETGSAQERSLDRLSGLRDR